MRRTFLISQVRFSTSSTAVHNFHNTSILLDFKSFSLILIMKVFATCAAILALASQQASAHCKNLHKPSMKLRNYFDTSLTSLQISSNPLLLVVQKTPHIPMFARTLMGIHR